MEKYFKPKFSKRNKSKRKKLVNAKQKKEENKFIVYTRY